MQSIKKSIKIYLNGKEKELSKETTIQDILDELDNKSPMFVVEINREIIPKDKYNYLLKENDNIEIVGFFGGG